MLTNIRTSFTFPKPRSAGDWSTGISAIWPELTDEVTWSRDFLIRRAYMTAKHLRLEFRRGPLGCGSILGAYGHGLPYKSEGHDKGIVSVEGKGEQ
jgi:hypothetical protein